MVLFSTISSLLAGLSLSFFSLQRQRRRDHDIYQRIVNSEVANQIIELAMNTMNVDSFITNCLCWTIAQVKIDYK